jgi:hypothetical protein
MRQLSIGFGAGCVSLTVLSLIMVSDDIYAQATLSKVVAVLLTVGTSIVELGMLTTTIIMYVRRAGAVRAVRSLC